MRKNTTPQEQKHISQEQESQEQESQEQAQHTQKSVLQAESSNAIDSADTLESTLDSSDSTTDSRIESSANDTHYANTHTTSSAQSDTPPTNNTHRTEHNPHHAHHTHDTLRFDTGFRSLQEKLAGESVRYITAGIMVAVIAALLIWDNPIIIWAVLGAVFILGFRESLALYNIEQYLGLYALALGIWVVAFFNASPIDAGIMGALVCASIIAYKQQLSPKALLPILYPTIPFLALYSVYKDFGVSHIVWLVLIIALCDIGAYFGGRLFGKTPFSPTSPKKTLEGVIIGIAVAIVIGSVAGIFMLKTHFFFAIFASVFVALCGVFGDLYESYLKRKASVKDSGSLLPGHGGILDRFDAVLFGAVGMHFLLMFFEAYSSAHCEIAPALGLQ